MGAQKKLASKYTHSPYGPSTSSYFLLLISVSLLSSYVMSVAPKCLNDLSCSSFTHCRWLCHLRQVSIGLYRDVWIAAIASSRTRLATLTGAMCKTSQCELRSLRVNSHCDVLHIAPIRVARLFLYCNGDFAIKAYGRGWSSVVINSLPLPMRLTPSANLRLPTLLPAI